jgi:lipid A 3-O-deacylase
MKSKFLYLLLFAFFDIGQLAAQPHRMFRLYEDNDLFNIQGNATDKAYSNGTRFNYFHRKQGALKSFVYDYMPRAGDSSFNTLGWSIMQIMITPTNILRRVPEAGDHYYSGALFFTHSLHSTNKVHKLSMQSEWIFGVMGPPALGKEAQNLVHGIIGSPRPMGWDYQLATDFLFNYNLTVEKGMVNYRNAVEVIGGAQVYAGTMLNGGSLFGVIRIGRLTPYFEDYIQQHTSTGKVKWFVLLRPSMELILYNALLEGGFFNDHPVPEIPGEKDGAVEVRRVGSQLDLGVGVALGKCSLSFTQKTMSAMIRGLPEHTVGNISLEYSW